MKVRFTKYHALLNDFLVIEAGKSRLAASKLSQLAQVACHRRSGIGADGILCLSRGRRTGWAARIVNSDGTHAEKSGNGLRMAILHLHSKDRRRRRFDIEMGSQTHTGRIISSTGRQVMVETELGSPRFETKQVPVRSRMKYMINAPLSHGGVKFPVTCLSIGNPHLVMLVVNFDFDWQSLGAELEHHRAFPNQTNVEFVKLLSRRRLQVADWERGAGATGSSGTGAAAAVCAGVMLGVCDRRCRVEFETGRLDVDWDEDSNLIKLTGPVVTVGSGEFDF